MQVSPHIFIQQHKWGYDFPYLDCAEKLAAAKMAASTSTLSWESKLCRILWWAFFLSGMMEAKLPSILNTANTKGLFYIQILFDRRALLLSRCHLCVLTLLNGSCTKQYNIQLYLRVMALATGSLLWMTENTLFTNSSTLRIFSKCFSLCCVTFSTHRRRKLFLKKHKAFCNQGSF